MLEYKTLQQVEGPGIPHVYQYGVEGDSNVMVMELLGKNLEQLFNDCGRVFTLKTVLLVAEQIIKRIEYFHSKSYIHRDIKPENFLIGLGAKETLIYIIDFGLSKQYRDPITNTHIPYAERRNFTGTARYASISTHVGIEQSRRDDLESIGHMIIYLAKGSLPWQGLAAATKKEKYQKILNKKMITGIDNLCQGLGPEFVQYMKYCKTLKFYDSPNYAYLVTLFKERYQKDGFEKEGAFDWVILSKKAEKSIEIIKFKEAKKMLDEKFAHMKFNKAKKAEAKKEEENIVTTK